MGSKIGCSQTSFQAPMIRNLATVLVQLPIQSTKLPYMVRLTLSEVCWKPRLMQPNQITRSRLHCSLRSLKNMRKWSPCYKPLGRSDWKMFDRGTHATEAREWHELCVGMKMHLCPLHQKLQRQIRMN